MKKIEEMSVKLGDGRSVPTYLGSYLTSFCLTLYPSWCRLSRRRRRLPTNALLSLPQCFECCFRIQSVCPDAALVGAGYVIILNAELFSLTSHTTNRLWGKDRDSNRNSRSKSLCQPWHRVGWTLGKRRQQYEKYINNQTEGGWTSTLPDIQSRQ